MTNINTQDAPNEVQEPQADVAALQAELVRLRTHSAELLADLKAERKAHKDTQTELQASKGGEDGAWKARYYQTAVVEPLERELAGLTPLPAKYLQDVCTSMGLLKMEEDAEGLARPVWYSQEGESADLTRGLYSFLVTACDAAPDSDLPKTLRGSGASGSGATSGYRVGYQSPATENEDQPKASPTQFGLR